MSDPALRFWLAMVEPSLPDVDRGRPNLALTRAMRVIVRLARFHPVHADRAQ